ncbi:UNVERIFIED_ORG: hypothetical protein C7432_3139 [Pantoea allii]
MKYQALSILQPAVELILDGEKKEEIRSWFPSNYPLKNILLIQNEHYLTFEDDEDEGLAMAFVDFTEFSPWTEEDYYHQGLKNTLGRVWKPGYFTWKIENIRKLGKPITCKAKKGIYEVELDEALILTD